MLGGFLANLALRVHFGWGCQLPQQPQSKNLLVLHELGWNTMLLHIYIFQLWLFTAVEQYFDTGLQSLGTIFGGMHYFHFIISFKILSCLKMRFLFPVQKQWYDKRLKTRGFLAELCGQVFAKDLKLYLNVSQQIRARPRFLMRLVCELSDNPVSCLLTCDNVFTLLLLAPKELL